MGAFLLAEKVPAKATEIGFAMKHLIRKCPNCGTYTLKQECNSCGVRTIDPHPPKYSPDDRYARYRIEDRYRGSDH
jgi:H/ACA ribonucleoprotein complex subunit 3